MGSSRALQIFFHDHCWYYSILGLLTGFLILFVPFVLGGIGAGDVKLLMALGAFLGAGAVIRIGLYGAVAGGLISTLILIRNYGMMQVTYRLSFLFTSIGNMQNRKVRRAQPQKKKLYIPYGLAIFMGLVINCIGGFLIWG